MAAAWCVSAARAWSADRPAAISGPDLAGTLSSRSAPSVAKANGTPARARTAAVAIRSFHSALRWARSFKGSSCSGSGRLRYSSSVGTLGSSGSVETKDDGDPLGLEAIDDLGGLAAADDHGGGPELLGQVECPVDLVAGIGLPPDRQLPVPRLPERTKCRVVGGSLLVAPLIELQQVLMLGVEHRLAEVGDRTHQSARIGVLGRALLGSEPPARGALLGRRRHRGGPGLPTTAPGEARGGCGARREP